MDAGELLGGPDTEPGEGEPSLEPSGAAPPPPDPPVVAPAPAPPPPPAVQDADARALRLPGECTYFVEDKGRITFYRSGNFEATCRVHHACRKTRTSAGPKGARRFTKPGQGRPAAYLAAWLAAARDPFDGALLTHFDWEPAYEVRRAMRTHLKGAGAAALALLAKERAQRSDEPNSEPEGPI